MIKCQISTYNQYGLMWQGEPFVLKFTPTVELAIQSKRNAGDIITSENQSVRVLGDGCMNVYTYTPVEESEQ